MNLTVKQLYPLIALCVFIFPGSLYSQDSSFEQLKEKFEQGEVFYAEFSHEAVDSYTNDTTASAGEIWVAREHYKIESEHQSVLVDGVISRVYDSNRNRVIISEYDPEEDDFAPSRMLNGIDSTYTVRKEEQQSDGYFIQLASDDEFAVYQQVDISLTPNLVPRQIKALDSVENIITTHFEEGRFMKLEEDIFTLDYPDTAEVVDLRN